MVPRKQGLIVNISSIGGVRYLFNVAYGIGKVNIQNNHIFFYSETNSNKFRKFKSTYAI